MFLPYHSLEVSAIKFTVTYLTLNLARLQKRKMTDSTKYINQRGHDGDLVPCMCHRFLSNLAQNMWDGDFYKFTHTPTYSVDFLKLILHAC